MASKVPLPRYVTLPEVVLFHREDPRDPTVILQVPNADKTDAQTYVLSLESGADIGWLEGLPNPKELRHQLDLEMHLAYCPQTGHWKAIEDLDAPGPFQQFMERARAEGAHQGESPIDKLWTRSRLGGRAAPIISPLRQALVGRGRLPFGGPRR
jgi:hypothetical protein